MGPRFRVLSTRSSDRDRITGNLLFRRHPITRPSLKEGLIMEASAISRPFNPPAQYYSHQSGAVDKVT